jgi:hypothetical protein
MLVTFVRRRSIYVWWFKIPAFSSSSLFLNSLMKKSFYLTLAVLLVSASLAFAADPPSLGNSGSPDPIPADGGLSILAASGGAYAFRKLRARRAAKADKKA